MTTMRRLAPALLAACDPLQTITVRQSIRPAPRPDCISGVLGASPLVLAYQWVDPERNYGADYELTLRVDGPDEPDEHDEWSAILMRDSAADGTAGALRVQYRWIADLGPRGVDDAVAMRRTAEALLAELHAACGTDDPPPAPTCERSNWPGQPRPCFAA